MKVKLKTLLYPLNNNNLPNPKPLHLNNLIKLNSKRDSKFQHLVEKIWLWLTQKQDSSVLIIKMLKKINFRKLNHNKIKLNLVSLLLKMVIKRNLRDPSTFIVNFPWIESTNPKAKKSLLEINPNPLSNNKNWCS